MPTFAEKPRATRPTTAAEPLAAGGPHGGRDHDPTSIFALQRTMGNRALLRLLQGDSEEPGAGSSRTAPNRSAHRLARIPVRSPRAGVLQAKLSVNRPGDKYEQEADRVAEQVTRMPAPGTQHACPCGGGCPRCRAGRPGQQPGRLQIMRLAPNDAAQSDVPPATHAVLRSPGQPLDHSTRSYFEPRFGHDFGHVRVHRGRQAERAARSIQARAFTAGNHIVIGDAQSSPGSREGQRLLAHELTHVIQQSGASGAHTGGQEARGLLQRVPNTGPDQRICGPDITASLTAMLGTVEPWFRGLTGFQQSRSCAALGPGGFLALVNPVMAWDTRQLFLPNTGWLDAYFARSSCGSPRDAGCPTDPTRHLCETAGSCGNSVVVDGKCMLAGTANYALFGKMCRLCHDYTGRWNRWDMRAIIGAWKTLDWDDATPPKEVASAAYDGTFPTLPAAAENRGSCNGRCGETHGGSFSFIWEPYRPR